MEAPVKSKGLPMRHKVKQSKLNASESGGGNSAYRDFNFLSQ